MAFAVVTLTHLEMIDISNTAAMDENGRMIALRVLHYVSPVLVLVYYAVTRTIATCYLHKPSKRAGKNARRYSAIVLLLAIVATLVGQAITYIAQALVQDGYLATQDCVIYVLASVFAFGFLALYLIETIQPLWYPQVGACMVAVAFEIPITALQALVGSKSSEFDSLRLALHALRSLLLSVLCLSACWYGLNDRPQGAKRSSDTEPLLSNGANGSTHKADYGAVSDSDEDYDDGGSDSDDDEPENVKKLKEDQQKRLQESGSWLSYLKEYGIFLPMVIPYKDRFIQGCVALVALILVAERFLNVLIPRQLGIITQEIADNYGTGMLPWRSIGVWMGLSLLGSRAGISVIQNIAEYPIQQCE